MNRRTLSTVALTALVVIAGAGCSDDNSGTSAGNSTAAGTSSAAATSGTGDYCQSIADLSRTTRELASKSDITPAEYAKTADQFDRVKPLAPAAAAGDLETISAGYRAIAQGKATIVSVGPDLARATLHLAEVNRAQCPPPGAPK